MGYDTNGNIAWRSIWDTDEYPTLYHAGVTILVLDPNTNATYPYVPPPSSLWYNSPPPPPRLGKRFTEEDVDIEPEPFHFSLAPEEISALQKRTRNASNFNDWTEPAPDNNDFPQSCSTAVRSTSAEPRASETCC